MMHTDTLTCQVRSDAVEPTSLSCSVPPLEWLDLWTTIGSIATALGTIALVVAAIWAGRIAVSTLRQMKSDSIAQTRPYVTAAIVPSIAGIGKYDLVIENTGNSTARNVKITCRPLDADRDEFTRALSDLFAMSHTLHPNRGHRVFWRLELRKGHTWSDGSTEPAGMPQDAVISIEYGDSNQGKYSDSFELTTRIFRMAPGPATGPNIKSSISDEQKDTHKMLAVIAAAIGELRR